jgi:hypothetical protein
MRRILLMKFVLACFLALSVLSCSREPSKKVIKTAIKELIEKEKNVPPDWIDKKNLPTHWHEVSFFDKLENARIASIDILQIGIFNKQELYWPIKASLKGTGELYKRWLATFGQEKEGPVPVEFSGIGDFKIYQDDYGNWKATLGYIER